MDEFTKGMNIDWKNTQQKWGISINKAHGKQEKCSWCLFSPRNREIENTLIESKKEDFYGGQCVSLTWHTEGSEKIRPETYFYYPCPHCIKSVGKAT